MEYPDLRKTRNLDEIYAPFSNNKWRKVNGSFLHKVILTPNIDVEMSVRFRKI